MENVAFNYWLVSPVEDVEFILRLILNTKDNDFCSPEILDFHMLPNMNSKNMWNTYFLNSFFIFKCPIRPIRKRVRISKELSVILSPFTCGYVFDIPQIEH